MRFAVPDWMKGTTIGDQVVAEAEELERTARGQLAAELRAVHAEQARRAPELAAAEAKAQARVAAARDALTEARTARAAAQSAAMGASSRWTQRIGALERQLRATADPAIGEFLVELDDMALATRKERFQTAMYGHRESVTNQPSIVARLEGIREARKAAESLMLEVLDEGAVAERIDAIRAGIPEIRPPEDFVPAGAKPWPPKD